MIRLDKHLLTLYPDFSRSRIEGLIKGGYVTVNGAAAAKAGMKIAEDDEIEVEIPPPVPAIPESEDIPLDVVFEDDDMLVVNKAPGMVVHPAPGHFTGTLVNALLHHCPNLSGIGGVARPGIVHRLDQYTSGLIVVAKSQAAMDGLVKAFSSHKNIEKTYLAVCHGSPRLNSGRIENLIGRHPVDRKRMAIVDPPPHGSAAAGKHGKVAITNWEKVEKIGGGGQRNLNSTVPLPLSTTTLLPLPLPLSTTTSSPTATSLIKCRIETGRTHQIRVHMASLGCPVIGDAVYGKSALDKKLDPVPQRQMLHAWRLKLWHPVKSVQMTFEAPVPEDMKPYILV